MSDLWQQTVFIFLDQTMRAFLGGLENALLLTGDNKARDSDTSQFKLSFQAAAWALFWNGWLSVSLVLLILVVIARSYPGRNRVACCGPIFAIGLKDAVQNDVFEYLISLGHSSFWPSIYPDSFLSCFTSVSGFGLRSSIKHGLELYFCQYD